MRDLTAHPDHAAHLAAVLAAPAEDAPRLVMADWLEEHGQAERAEFIRVQCELARLPAVVLRPEWGGRFGPKCMPNPDCETLRRRERELLAGNRANWRDFAGPAAVALCPEASLYTEHLTFRRGFVEHVTCTAADWLAHGPAVVAAHPVAEVRLADKAQPPIRGWWSSRDEAGSWRDFLPWDLFDRLRGGELAYPGDALEWPYPPETRPHARLYASEADALADLSRACLAFARGEP